MFRRTLRLALPRVGLVTCLLLGLPPAGRCADVPTPPCRQWGDETLASLDKEFWLTDRHLYVEKIQLHQPPAPPPTLMWGAGVMLSALAAAAKVDSPRYGGRLREFIDALNSYWTNANNIGGYDVWPGPKPNDRFYDDNAWMVLSLLEAYEVTNRSGDLARAEAAYRFVLSGEDAQLGGGIYWHEPHHQTKNTCVSAPATVGALRLYQFTGKPAYLEDARRLYRWTCTHLQGADGLFADKIKLEGEVVDESRFSYNSGLMIRAAAMLYQATREPEYLSNAQRIAHAAETRWVSPETGGIRDTGRFAHLLLEGFLALWRVDHDPHWITQEKRALIFLHDQVRDSEGHYGDHWDRTQTTPRDTIPLLDQASAARAYWAAIRPL